MGVLPLQFPDGENAASLGLTGEEEISIAELDVESATELEVTARRDGTDDVSFMAKVRIDTANERKYFRHGGILHRVLRELR
jgi:aconitate hydratase